MTENKLYNKIWIHTIFGVRNKLPIILPELEPTVYKILNDCFKNQDCIVDAINGTADHVHIVFQLSPKDSLKDVLTEVLYESKGLINQGLFSANSFDWSETSASYSISSSQLEKVSEYIKNQKEIHKIKTFQKEFDEFLQVHKLHL